jgi:hypothetical protein
LAKEIHVARDSSRRVLDHSSIVVRSKDAFNETSLKVNSAESPQE